MQDNDGRWSVHVSSAVMQLASPIVLPSHHLRAGSECMLTPITIITHLSPRWLSSNKLWVALLRNTHLAHTHTNTHTTCFSNAKGNVVMIGGSVAGRRGPMGSRKDKCK